MHFFYNPESVYKNFNVLVIKSDSVLYHNVSKFPVELVGFQHFSLAEQMCFPSPPQKCEISVGNACGITCEKVTS